MEGATGRINTIFVQLLLPSHLEKLQKFLIPGLSELFRYTHWRLGWVISRRGFTEETYLLHSTSVSSRPPLPGSVGTVPRPTRRLRTPSPSNSTVSHVVLTYLLCVGKHTLTEMRGLFILEYGSNRPRDVTTKTLTRMYQWTYFKF